MGGFLHDVHIVQAGVPGQGIAHVFLIAGHVLLPVQVVGRKAHLPGGFQAHAHHGRCLVPIGERGVFQVHAAGALDGQGMHGEAFRVQPHGRLHGTGKVLRMLPRQPGDHIHVDMPHALRPGHGIGLLHLLRGVGTADHLQGTVVHGLRIDADAPHARLTDGPQLAGGDGIRPPGLHGVLSRPGIQRHQPLQQAGQLILVQRGGRAAAHIDRAELFPCLPQQTRALLHFMEQCLQVWLHQLSLAQLARGKGAVRAPCGAEGNAYIHVDLPVIRLRQSALRPRHIPQKQRLFLRHVKGAAQPGHSLILRQPRVQRLVEQVRGPHPRQAAPGGMDARHLTAQVVQCLTAQPPRRPLAVQRPQLRVAVHGNSCAALGLAAIPAHPAVIASAFFPCRPGKAAGVLPRRVRNAK